LPGARRIRCIESNTFGRANVAIGDAALANNISGDFDTAIGTGALFRLNMGVGSSLDSGNGNSAFGASTLGGNLHGSNNTATGCGALNGNNGSNNTVTGAQALSVSQFGYDNTAFGYQALHNSTGDQNIAIGSGAGVALVSGTKNIYVGHRGVASESKTIRLGNVQTRTFIAGVATAAVTGTNVVINTAGQLGVPLSSARYKRDIEPMGGRSDGVLKLRPVTFVYKQDEQGVRQYGLIAEEVAAVYSELVTHTATGEVQAVRYQELIPMLVNEVQRQQHVIERLERPQHVTEHLQRELAELRSLVGQMRGGHHATVEASRPGCGRTATLAPAPSPGTRRRVSTDAMRS
jgi:hypothetical protein